MASGEDIDVKDRADRALRAGRAREALALYTGLLARVQVLGSGHYESWLEGALAAYEALRRRREAGYVMLGLRRFGDALTRFSPESNPYEWALCASRLGRRSEAARLLAEAGHPALAAFELDAAGDFAAARAQWERVLAHPRLRGLPYETALARFNLGETLLKLGERTAAERELAQTQLLLEELADEFESRGERERAFDCYGILLRLGKDTGSFENVAEGYLNTIRILASDDQRFYVLQYYDDFLEHAVKRGELHAAATLAREAAEYSLKAGLVYDRHYLGRAASLWVDAARQNEASTGPTDLSENALHAAIDAATQLGDLARVGQVYALLANLPLPAKKRERYASLARRYAHARSESGSAPSFPDYLRRPGAYMDVWRQDLVEWELAGDPAPVLARVVVEREDHPRFPRLALRALLVCADPAFRPAEPRDSAELAYALGRIQVYDVLRPLERLYEHPAPQVRTAVMEGVGQVYSKRSFGLVRKGLSDPDPSVQEKAIGALKALKFRDAMDPLTRIFRESSDEAVRKAAVQTVAEIGTLEAGLFLIEVLRHESGELQRTAKERLARFSGEDLAPLLRQYLDVEAGESRAALEYVLQAMEGRLPTATY